jgi:RNA polymerase sigma-70 factor, ECF subfamily
METGMLQEVNRRSSMATTVLGINPDPVAVEGYSCTLQELSDVITRHSPRFRRIALGRLGNVADAEDAVQDALLSALTHVDQFKARAQMSTWLTTIVINSARMRLRRRLPQVQVSLDETSENQNISLADVVSDTRPGPEDAYRQREIAERLARATSRLSPTLRTTFELRHFDGLSIRETADLLRVPAGTVKARLARARTSLKEVIEKGLRKRVKRPRYSPQH